MDIELAEPVFDVSLTPVTVTVTPEPVVLDVGEDVVSVDPVEAVVTVSLETTEVQVTQEGVVIEVSGVPGPRGATGATGPAGTPHIEVPFAFGDATPAQVCLAGAGKTIFSIMLVVFEPFNGTDPALTIGDAADPDRLMTAADNDPATAATYQTHPGYAYPGDTNVLLSISPGAGTTQGSGLIYIEIEVN